MREHRKILHENSRNVNPAHVTVIVIVNCVSGFAAYLLARAATMAFQFRAFILFKSLVSPVLWRAISYKMI